MEYKQQNADFKNFENQNSSDLELVNRMLVFENEEKKKHAAQLMDANRQLAYQNEEKEKRAAELVIINKELAFHNEEREKRAAELIIANKELVYQNEEKGKRADELIIANKELAYQNEEKEKRAAELIIANKELVYQNEEKGKRADELIIANKELAYQNEEKEKRAAELIIANKELVYQNEEKEKRAAELIIANKELVYQNEEKGKRADELIIANKELAYQNEEKEKRAAELIIANKELVYQNEEKEKRADELIIANKELAYQNQEKEKRATELEIINKELHSFAYVSSHDLQEPLRKIRNFSDRLLEKEKENLSENGKIYLTKIQSSAALMQQLIEDLLAFSRINTTDGKFIRTDLDTILDEIKIQFSELIEEKKAVINSGGLGEAIVVRFQFRQLMYNLVGNALKFSRPGIHPHIIISSRTKTGAELQIGNPFLTERLHSEIKYCHIVFEDNGIGFESQFNEHIFEVFKKLHPKEDYAGTGIGLAIVKKIVENHQGIILANASMDTGATFDIYIPEGQLQ